MKHIKYFLLITLSIININYIYSEDIIDQIENLPDNIFDVESDVKNNINPIDDFRQRQSSIINSIYENDSMAFLINISEAQAQINELNKELSKIETEFWSIEKRKLQVNARYNEIRQSILNIISNMRDTEAKIQNRLIRINMQSRRIMQLEESILNLNSDLNLTRSDIATYTNILYRINNDFYWKWLDIDDIKLLVRSENIADSLSSEDLIKSMVFKMNELIYVMENNKSKYIEYSDELMSLRQQNREELSNYRNELTIYQEQKKYLSRLVEYLKEDRDEVNSQYDNLLNNRSQVESKISSLSSISENEFKDILNGSSFKKLIESDDRPDNWNFLSWPVNWFNRISAFYDDSRYKRQFWADHFAIDIVVRQWTEIYAPADWVVYHVVDQDGPWLNWLIIVHKHGYITVYLHMSKIFPNEWDFVKRWEIIGLSWWIPWTRWAWLLSSWQHLHFEVIKNNELVDPLLYMDLSVIPSKDMLPNKYHLKYISDSVSRNIDMSDLPVLSWTTVYERRVEYLRRNWFWQFADIKTWEDAARNLNVDIDLGICIWAAESWLWRNLTTPYNVWNVWNNDRWDRIWYESAFQWARVIYLTLTNRFLWHYTMISDLSRYWNPDWTIYASSDYNWQRNVVRCLSSIKWYWVPDDYFYRVYTWNKDIVFNRVN